MCGFNATNIRKVKVSYNKIYTTVNYYYNNLNSEIEADITEWTSKNYGKLLKDFEKRVKILSDEGWNCNKCRHELYDN